MLIFLAVCSQSNKFSSFELFALMKTTPHEYYLTNQYSRFTLKQNHSKQLKVPYAGLLSSGGAADEIRLKFNLFMKIRLWNYLENNKARLGREGT